MARSRNGTRSLLAVVAAVAIFCRPTAFVAPLQAAALAGALLAGSPAIADVSPAYDFGSSIQVAAKPLELGGKVVGGLDGTYQLKGDAKKSDFVENEKALKQEEKFTEKFDQYIGVFGILFVGAFIAPMVTYFWYVRDEDPWKN
mmetsp:Transcript_40922/g.121344  ORF Transcript_40922/g.121344 Transcript_40922/m.121344 type:complete len:144 (+) Transcript_40922:54-485(+)